MCLLTLAISGAGEGGCYCSPQERGHGRPRGRSPQCFRDPLWMSTQQSDVGAACACLCCGVGWLSLASSPSCAPRREGGVMDIILTGLGCPGKSVICFRRKVTRQTFCSQGLEIFPRFDRSWLDLPQLTLGLKHNSTACHGNAFCVVIKIHSI